MLVWSCQYLRYASRVGEIGLIDHVPVALTSLFNDLHAKLSDIILPDVLLNHTKIQRRISSGSFENLSSPPASAPPSIARFAHRGHTITNNQDYSSMT